MYLVKHSRPDLSEVTRMIETHVAKVLHMSIVTAKPALHYLRVTSRPCSIAMVYSVRVLAWYVFGFYSCKVVVAVAQYVRVLVPKLLFPHNV